MQGWEPVFMTSSTMAVENSKFRLRLPIEQNVYLFYEAIRSQNHFHITIYQNLRSESGKEYLPSRYDKMDHLTMIQKMDKLNSFKFSTLITINSKPKEKLYRQNTFFNFLGDQNSNTQILNYISNHREWGKFFKIKKMCFKFEPHLLSNTIEQFKNEVMYIIGPHLLNNIHVKQSDKEVKCNDKLDGIEAPNRKVMLTKLNAQGDILELQMAFLRYPHNQLKQTVEQLKAKICNHTYKKNIRATTIPHQIALFHKNQLISSHQMFNKKWVLKFRSNHYSKLFNIYWESTLKKMSYNPIYMKGQTGTKKYYKIIDVNTDEDVHEISTFLSTKEIGQKNEMIVHFSIPPSFYIIQPFHKDANLKAIYLPQLVHLITSELKGTQRDIIKLVDTYQAIHKTLLEKATVKRPKAISSALEEQIVALYDIRTTYINPINLEWSCKALIYKYYREHTKSEYHLLPSPSKLLMSTDLQYIQGDVNITVDDKQYAFFLCSPFKYLYLQKRDKNLYYKFVNMHYEQLHLNEVQNNFIEAVLKEVIQTVNQQIYINDFKLFLEGKFKGDVAKLIQNQQFTYLQEKCIDTIHIFDNCQKFYLAVVPKDTIEQKRIRNTLQIFTRKFFQVIEEFFPEKRGDYYFPIRNKQQKQPPFSIDPGISRGSHKIFLRLQLNVGESIDITAENLTELIVKNYQNLAKSHAFFSLKFYLTAKNHTEKCIIFINTLTQLISGLCEETSYIMEKAIITKKDTLIYYLDSLAFLWVNNTPKDMKLSLINKQCQNLEPLCNSIEHEVMQHCIPFKRIRPSHTEYMILDDDKKGTIQIKGPFLMKVTRGKLQFHYHRSPRFFLDEQVAFEDKIQNEYYTNLCNFINGNVLMNELISTYELPWEPKELWLSENINQQKVKNLITTTKKTTKRNHPAVSKFLTKKAPKFTQQKEQSITESSHQESTTQKIPLHLIGRSYIGLNDRISPNKVLNYLLEDQVFNLSIVHNMKNLHLFERFIGQNHVLFFFQEVQDQNFIKQISEENKQSSYPKCKIYLVYSAYCINPLLDFKALDNKILPRLNEVIHKQLFDEVAKSLIASPKMIPEFEESFIKRKEGEDKKQIKFDLPLISHKDHIIQYIIQHLEVFHYRVQFKAQNEKSEKNKAQTLSENKFLDSIKYVEPFRLDTVRSQVISVSSINLEKKYSFESFDIQSQNLTTANDKKNFSDRLQTGSISAVSTNLKSSEIVVEGQSQAFYEYNDFTWLFNCIRPNQNLTQIYGKCLYIMKLKFKEEINNKPLDRECLPINNANYLFTKIQNVQSTFEATKSFAGRKSTKGKAKSALVFEISDYVGNPNFPRIQDTFSFITRACVGEVFLENYLLQRYAGILHELNSWKEVNKNREMESQQRDVYLKSKVFPIILNSSKQFEVLIHQIQSLLFFKYSSNLNILMKDKSFYFMHFLQQFCSIIHLFKQAFSVKASLKLDILFYGKTNKKKHIYVLGDLGDIQNFLIEIDMAIRDHELTRIGFICSDYISTIMNSFPETSSTRGSVASAATGSVASSVTPSSIGPKSQVFQLSHHQSVTLNDFKYFKDFDYVEEYKFKRSAVIFYQISDTDFIYGSYNIKPEIDEQIKQYLSAIDCWLSQKAKLYSLIVNIKENGIYEYSFKHEQNEKKVNPFYTLRKQELNESKQKFVSELSMYRLMINLVFKELPEPHLKQSQKNETHEKQQNNNLASEFRVKHYIHYHSQGQTLMNILKKSPVHYKYPPYMGTQKFALERVGREYVSLLREQYGGCLI